MMPPLLLAVVRGINFLPRRCWLHLVKEYNLCGEVGFTGSQFHSYCIYIWLRLYLLDLEQPDTLNLRE